MKKRAFLIVMLCMTFIAYAQKPINFEIFTFNTSNQEKSNGSAKIIFKDGKQPYNIFIITDSKTGIKTLTTDKNEYLIEGLYAGKYKIFLTDSDKNQSEYKFIIE